jgi:hypothetical protein
MIISAIYFLLNLQSAAKKLSSFATFNSGVGSGRPPHVMFFFVDLGAAFAEPALAATALPLAAAAGAGDDLALLPPPPPPPPKSVSRLEAGIFEPGQLNEGMAFTAVW